MGTDFFDGLGETLTRTARELGERAEQIYETQRIRNKISAEERIVDKLMADMGNLLYRRYKSGETVDGELSTFCEEIDQHFLKIKEYKSEAADLRGKKICPSCGKAVDKEVSFCPYCGAACPVPERTESEEEESETVETTETEETTETAETTETTEMTAETEAEECTESTAEKQDNTEEDPKTEDGCGETSGTEAPECQCEKTQEEPDCGSKSIGD